MKTIGARFWLIFLVSWVERDCFGEVLHKIWEIRVGEQIRAARQTRTQNAVFGIRFSPDGNNIAVSIESIQSDGQSAHRVVVVKTQGANREARTFIVDAHQEELLWSASSDMLLAGQTLIHMDSGAICKLPFDLGRGFVAPHRIISRTTIDPRRVSSNDPTKFILFNDSCQEVDDWQTEPDFFLDDVSADRGLLFGHIQHGPAPPTDNLLIDASAKKVIDRRPSREGGGEGRFANFGKAICLATLPTNRKAVPLQCFNVDSGKLISEAPKINGGYPAFAADHSSRIVADDTRTVSIPFGELGTIFERRVVWNFETGKELVSWAPDTQTYVDSGTKPPLLVKKPFSVAISPDGNYIAEGGNDVLRLYKVE